MFKAARLLASAWQPWLPSRFVATRVHTGSMQACRTSRNSVTPENLPVNGTVVVRVSTPIH
jgi:hypothetical protein